MTVIHLKSSDNQKSKGDLILNIRHPIELVTKLIRTSRKHQHTVKCTTSEKVDVKCIGLRNLTFSQQEMPDESPIVKKSSNSFLVYVPSA